MTATPQIAMLQIASVRESPLNPRKTFDEKKLAELTESIRNKGVLQPVLVRTAHDGIQDGYELVYGHRRLRAAKAAGLELIPAMVRDMDDKEVLEAQVVENCQREDVHPLEEADGFRALHEQHGYSVEEIAAKLGKSSGFVYARIKLCALGEYAREEFLEERLTPSTALLVARIPDVKLQEQATKEITRVDFKGTVMSYRAAVSHVQATYMLRLAEAGFEKGDATLIPGAGPCKSCPKRTGNQRELFSDVKSADVCTDPICFKAKQDAGWVKTRNAAWAKGQKVLDAKQAKEVLNPYNAGSLNQSSGYIDLDDRCWEDPKERSWRQLLGQDAPVPTLVRDERSGEVLEVVERTAAKLAAPDIFKPVAQTTLTDQEAKRRKEALLKGEATREAIRQIVKREEDNAGPPPPDFWALFVRGLVAAAWSETQREVARRRDWMTKGDARQAADAITEAADAMGAYELRGLALEMLLTRGAGGPDGSYGEVLKDACQLYGLDLEELEAEQRALGKPKKPKGKAKKPAAPEGDVCATCGKPDPKGDYYGGLCTACDNADPQPEGCEEPGPKAAKKTKAKKTAAEVA